VGLLALHSVLIVQEMSVTSTSTSVATSVASVRARYLDFFRQRLHTVVASAPIVNSDDPTLLFTNAGMNPFKDIFTGAKPVVHPRIVDTQKCLRVSGKHNDLEEVGYDTYHHTMFEMLGNWSFGDYFKKEAIAWAWEFVTGELGIDPERLYVTVFEGAEGIPLDQEAIDEWKKVLPADRILPFGKKDNFWEMGETGPCGPCTEIHVDVRPGDYATRNASVNCASLVNAGTPECIEIWNLVFIQFNRKADTSLEPLKMKSVDTGMGLERLCMVLQGKQSTYDTDVFTPLMAKVEQLAGVTYGGSMTEMRDIAVRVIVDHIRAIALAIGDGQLPSATGAGYVIRRILRRASRYGFQHLGLKQPFLHELVPVLVGQFRGVFDELVQQEAFVRTVIEQEEKSFLRTLESGLRRLDQTIGAGAAVGGEVAFELFDTYGFPLDLTQLIARERNLAVDVAGFEAKMAEQKARSKQAGKVATGDWVEVSADAEPLFVGYDLLSCDTEILRYRIVKTNKEEQVHAVLSRTPFYAESGGQVGDVGTLTQGSETVRVLDTFKENQLTVHRIERVLAEPAGTWRAQVDAPRRHLISSNHTATHLLHAALRQVLGTHVEQRGSLVEPGHLRFDFSHFQKVSESELELVEHIVNQKIGQGIALEVFADTPIEQAKAMGAMALFGEKYGERVRVIRFQEGFSTELCGGTHVQNTVEIRYFTITSEGSVAAGVRRIEAQTNEAALERLREQQRLVGRLSSLLKSPKDIERSVSDLLDQQRELQTRYERLRGGLLMAERDKLVANASAMSGRQVVVANVEVDSADELKTLSFELRKALPAAAVVLGAVVADKPLLSVILADSLTVAQGGSLDAVKLIKEIAAHIQGGGGGQAFYATAGGKRAEGLSAALDQARALLS
jgi:alanyl-tRNA synthetase